MKKLTDIVKRGWKIPSLIGAVVLAVYGSNIKKYFFPQFEFKLPELKVPKFIEPEYKTEIFMLDKIQTHHLLNQIGFYDLGIDLPFKIEGSELEYNFIRNFDDLKKLPSAWYMSALPNRVSLSLPNLDKPNEGIEIEGVVNGGARLECSIFYASGERGFVTDTSYLNTYEIEYGGVHSTKAVLRKHNPHGPNPSEDPLLRNAVRILHLLKAKVEKSYTPIKTVDDYFYTNSVIFQATNS